MFVKLVKNLILKIQKKNYIKFFVFISLDLLCSIFSLILINYLILSNSILNIPLNHLIISFLFLVIFLLNKNYLFMFRFSNISYYIQFLKSFLYLLFFIFFLKWIILKDLEVSFIINYIIFFFFFLISTRFFIKIIYKELFLVRKKTKNVILYGAGQAGSLFNNLSLNQYNIAAYVDDDKNKQGKKIFNINIYKPEKIENLIKNFKIDFIIIAIPSLSESNKEKLLSNLNKYNLPILISPSINNLVLPTQDFLSQFILSDFFQKKIKWDLKDYYTNFLNKKILITGSGGSIGSELSLQILKLKPKMLILVDNSEFNLYKLKLQVDKFLKNDTNTKVVFRLTNIVDKDLIKKIFIKFDPEYIFHAAAYKHVNLVEINQYDTIRTNIEGTINLCNLAKEFNVEKFILISTDKAVNPISFMGITKRFNEMLIQYYNLQNDNKTKFSAVRFGNVINSAGSVVPLFNKQILSREKIMITHPEVTRFFMSIPQAVGLVIYSSIISNGGEIHVLKFNSSIKILELAKKMANIYGFKLSEEIHDPNNNILQYYYTGLNPGEKIYEELFYDNKKLTSHNEYIFLDNHKFDTQSFENAYKDIIKLIDEKKYDDIYNILSDFNY